MKKSLFILIFSLISIMGAYAQLPKVYDETIDPMEQIDMALKDAKGSDRYVICQIGGNWCPWCLRFADFIKKDAEIAKVVDDNFVYIHVNYPRTGAPENLLKRLGNPGRFGYPVFVVLKTDGSVLHIQDSSFLEEGKGYDQKKVLRFFNGWTPKAVAGVK